MYLVWFTCAVRLGLPAGGECYFIYSLFLLLLVHWKKKKLNF